MKPTNSLFKDFTSYQLLIISIIATLQFTVVLDFMVISPLGDILMKALDMNTTQFGEVVAAYAFAAGASGILAAGFADKFDRKKLLLFLYGGFILGTFFCALAESYVAMLVARIVTGLFGGIIGSVSLAIVTDLFAPEKRGKVMGIVQMSFAASQVMGIPIGIKIANSFGWHSAFLLIVGLSVITALCIYFLMRPVNAHLKSQHTKAPLAHLLGTLTNSRYQVGFAAIVFLSIGGFMIMPFGSAFLINNLRITEEQLPLVYLFSGMSSLIVMPLMGVLSDRYNKFIIFTLGSLLALAVVIFYTNQGPIPLWAVVLINIVMFIGIMGRAVPASTLNTSVPAMQDRGAYMSISSALQQMAGGIGAVVAGYIVVQPSKTAPIEHYDTLGYIVSGFFLLSIFLIYRVHKMVKVNQPLTAAALSKMATPNMPAPALAEAPLELLNFEGPQHQTPREEEEG